MRNTLLIPMAGLVLLSACNTAKKPSGANFSAATRSHTPAAPPSTCDEFTDIALLLCERVELGSQQLYRLVGVGLSNFQAGEDAPSPLFEESSARLQMVDHRMQERGMD